jgi:hypothetical protein
MWNAKIANKRFFAGLFQLGWLREKTGLVRINWRDMETEEFGSVYESLLELVPTFKDGCGKFYFLNGLGDDVEAGTEAVRGNQRKITSSYYTKDALVEFLLNSALDPVIEKIIAENPGNPDALLRISVLDSACGSGHFILAAAAASLSVSPISAIRVLPRLAISVMRSARRSPTAFTASTGTSLRQSCAEWRFGSRRSSRESR